MLYYPTIYLSCKTVTLNRSQYTSVHHVTESQPHLALVLVIISLLGLKPLKPDLNLIILQTPKNLIQHNLLELGNSSNSRQFC